MKRLRSARAVLLLALVASPALAQTQTAPPPAPAPTQRPGIEVDRRRPAHAEHEGRRHRSADRDGQRDHRQELHRRPDRAGQGHGGLGAADEARRNLRRVPFGAARARLCGGAVRQHGQDRARSDGAAGRRRRPTPSANARADELVTQIVPVKHVSAAELVPILRPLMPQGGQLIAHASSNSLIVSDRAGNVQRLVGIIQRIDTVVRCRSRSDSAGARERVRDRAHADAARRRQERTARRSAARVRRHAHELDPDLRRRRRDGSSCARSSRISIRRSTTAAIRR